MAVHTRARKRSSTAPMPDDGTRLRLIQAALDAFSVDGINAVSLRTITAAAGQGNQSAVHYHFDNKMGLVEAVLQQVCAWLEPMQAEVRAELASNPEAGASVRNLTVLMVAPFVRLFQSSPQGRKAIRFLSRLTWQAGGEGQALLVRALQPYFRLFEPPLKRLLPDKPGDAISFHGYMAVNSMIHGLSDISLLGKETAPAITQLYRERPERLLEYFHDYIAGGLAAPAAASRRKR